MNFNWKKLSINDLEKNYNPREAVFNFSDYIEEYKTLGKEFRKKLPCILDVSYGDTPLQKLDIFGMPFIMVWVLFWIIIEFLGLIVFVKIDKDIED